LHDDLVDEAAMRRGKPVAHSTWGNSITVLVGDYLLARALSISAGTGRLRVVQVLAQLTENMSQGEVHQLMRKGDVTLTEAEYLEVIRRKTAVLFQAACTVSAVIADATEEKEKALSDFGYHLGIAFQMVDDLFDYTMDTADLGKEVGADLREGKLTLPVIHALKQSNPADRDQMVQIIKKIFCQDTVSICVSINAAPVLVRNIEYMAKKKETYPVLGMTCAVCVAKIEKVLGNTEGINEASVNFASENVTISYDDDIIDLEKISGIIKDIGYELLT